MFINQNRSINGTTYCSLLSFLNEMHRMIIARNNGYFMLHRLFQMGIDIFMKNISNISVQWYRHMFWGALWIRVDTQIIVIQTQQKYLYIASVSCVHSIMSIIVLTHWGRVTLICVGNLIIIGLDNGLSPHRRQAIISTNAGILLIGPPGTNFRKISIEILTSLFKKMRLKRRNGGHFVLASMC